MNPRPLGPEDSAENSRGAFVPVWCCLFRECLLSGSLRSNVSIRSRRGLGRRLGQAVKIFCPRSPFDGSTPPHQMVGYTGIKRIRTIKLRFRKHELQQQGRLCKRMGLFEKLLPDTIPLTEEQFKTFLEQTVLTEHSRRILDGLTAQNAATAPAQR